MKKQLILLTIFSVFSIFSCEQSETYSGYNKAIQIHTNDPLAIEINNTYLQLVNNEWAFKPGFWAFKPSFTEIFNSTEKKLNLDNLRLLLEDPAYNKNCIDINIHSQKLGCFPLAILASFLNREELGKLLIAYGSNRSKIKQIFAETRKITLGYFTQKLIPDETKLYEKEEKIYDLWCQEIAYDRFLPLLCVRKYTKNQLSKLPWLCLDKVFQYVAEEEKYQEKVTVSGESFYSIPKHALVPFNEKRKKFIYKKNNTLCLLQ